MCFRPAQAKINRCPKCGKVNKPMATVCVECGAELEPTTPSEQSSTPPAGTPGGVTPPKAPPTPPKAPPTPPKVPPAPPKQPEE